MWMFASRLQLEQIDNINEPDLEIRKFLSEKCDRSQGLLSGNVASGCDHDVRFAGFIVAGPVPDTDALGAVCDGLLHGQELQVLLFVG